MGECRFCSEAPQDRGRSQHGRCTWLALPRHSWPPGALPHESAGCGGVSDMPGHLPGVSPARAFPLGLGLS